MIPKKIHYCWFGGNPLPEDVKRYIESWKKYCPDYELIRWDESNYDVHKNTYVELAYQNKKWAFLTDYARLDTIYEHGGIYLDADVELVHGLDDLLQNNCYMGMEQVGTVNTGLGFGAEPKHPFLRENMKPYEEQNFIQEDGTFKPPICVRITTTPTRSLVFPATMLSHCKVFFCFIGTASFLFFRAGHGTTAPLRAGRTNRTTDAHTAGSADP